MGFFENLWSEYVKEKCLRNNKDEENMKRSQDLLDEIWKDIDSNAINSDLCKKYEFPNSTVDIVCSRTTNDITFKINYKYEDGVAVESSLIIVSCNYSGGVMIELTEEFYYSKDDLLTAIQEFILDDFYRHNV